MTDRPTNPSISRWQSVLDDVHEHAGSTPLHQTSGRLVRANGMILEASGLQVPVGSSCRIALNNALGAHLDSRYSEAEVVGFSGDRTYLMPLEAVSGLVPGARVLPMRSNSHDGARLYPVGDSLLGRVLDSSGNPLDQLGPLTDVEREPLATTPINPVHRAPINTQIDVGIRAINALLSVGRGQRMGLFAGSGVGKSVLLGMMSRYTTADVIVVGLIGERGREVQDFIDNILSEEDRSRAVVVAAPADTSPLQRLQGASYATRIAEHYRDAGQNVLLIMDSLTRYAMAQREIALAIGEPPATKGYPPSVFAKLPALVERAGNGAKGSGSITAFYTVLTEGDDQQDPIADAARAILDGHIVLSRELAEAGHYPAIDIEASISRAMDAVVDKDQELSARHLKKMFSRYHRNRDMIGVGAYTPGNDLELDAAVNYYPHIEAFLQQPTQDCAPIKDSLEHLNQLMQAARGSS